MSNVNGRRRPAGTIAASLRSLAGHLYRVARDMDPVDGRNAYAGGLREAALIACRRASNFENMGKAKKVAAKKR